MAIDFELIAGQKKNAKYGVPRFQPNRVQGLD
jgi:hypothetical protein